MITGGGGVTGSDTVSPCVISCVQNGLGHIAEISCICGAEMIDGITKFDAYMRDNCTTTLLINKPLEIFGP